MKPPNFLLTILLPVGLVVMTTPASTSIGTGNSAFINVDVSVSSQTGSNSVSGTGDVVIDTGSATASAWLDNTVNTILTLDTSPTATPSIEMAATPTPISIDKLGISGANNQKSFSIETNNQVKVANQATVSAETGDNIALDNLGEIRINTEDATAWVNLINLLNTNIVDSDFELLVMDLVEENGQTINLNELWCQLSEKEMSGEKISIFNMNDVYLTNKVDVLAKTGGNEGDSDQSVTIESGNATALTNVANIVNTNILEAKFYFGIINIIGNSQGDLILPRLNKILMVGVGSSQPFAGTMFVNSNKATINNQSQILTDSGTNSASESASESLIETGEALAVTNNYTLANLDLWQNNLFYLLFNNLGGWQGKILNWSFPGASENPGLGSQEFSAVANKENFGTSSVIPTPRVDFQNHNQATITNELTTFALTGDNRADSDLSDAEIKTGRARATTNLFNFVNLNIMDGNWFFNVVNILGSWSGNAIFAYPDLAAEISASQDEAKAGDTFILDVGYTNRGYDLAKNVRLKLELSPGLSYLSDSSGLKAEVNGQTYFWPLGNLEPGQKGSFLITVKVAPSFDLKKITAMVIINSEDPEIDWTNNSSSVSIVVYQPIQANFGADSRCPVLAITAWNNVNDFVYPGDTVTFVITIENKGDVAAREAVFSQKLFNGGLYNFGEFNFNLGTIEPGKKGRLTFGIKLVNSQSIEADNYWTMAQILAKAPNDDKIYSNEARTDFKVKLRHLSFFPGTIMVEPERVLGLSPQSPSYSKNETKILTYILLFCLSTLLLINMGKKRLRSRG